MAVDGVEPPFMTTAHWQVVGLTGHWPVGRFRAAMWRPAVVQPLMASNGSFSTLRIHTTDPFFPDASSMGNGGFLIRNQPLLGG